MEFRLHLLKHYYFEKYLFLAEFCKQTSFGLYSEQGARKSTVDKVLATCSIFRLLDRILYRKLYTQQLGVDKTVLIRKPNSPLC